MKTLIVYWSYHHFNTKKIATAMAEEIEADIVVAGEQPPIPYTSYDVIGFGSGIYAWSYHPKLLNLIAEIDINEGQRVFSFCTYGIKKDGYQKKMKAILEDKGFEVIGQFGCYGYDTFGPLALFGGIKRDHPTEEDVLEAKNFVKSLVLNHS